MPKKIFELSGIISVDGLEATIKGLQNVGKEFEKAEKAFFKFGRQINSAGSKLTSAITVPVVAAAGAATLAAKAFGEYGDKIQDMSKLTGLTTDTIQELKQVASDAGTDFESFVDTIYSVTKNMPAFLKGSGEASKTLRNLGVNVFDVNGKFRDSDSLFTEIIKKLQNIPGSLDRLGAAQAIFGRRTAAITDILNMTNAEFDASRQKAHDLGLVMSGEGLKAADDFRVALNDATNQLVAMGRSALLDLLPIFKDTLFPLFRDSIIPALKDMALKISEVAKWFNDLDSGTKKAIIGFAGFAVAAGPVLITVGKLIGTVASVTAAMKTMQAAFVGFTGFMATNPLGIALIGIGLLTTAIIGVVNALDKIKKKKAEMAADKSYSATAEEERRDNEENIRLWQERLNWLERQRRPTQVMIEEMNDLREAIKATNEVLGKGTPKKSGGVPIIDPEAEARKQKAIEEEKKKQEEIAKVNAQYSERLWQAEFHTKEERWQRERELALIEVAKIGGDVALAAEALDKEHLNKVAEEAAEEQRIKEEKHREYVEYVKRAQQEIIDSMIETAHRYLSVVSNIGSGIAGIFQQSTMNKQVALDNQQQAERDAIESSVMGEKQKRKALFDLDKKQDREQRSLRRQAAKESKNIAIFESIMGTANAVINALATVAVPLNFIYAGIVGTIGAIKTGLIAAQPLPLAKGATVRGGRGGIMAEIGEENTDEIVMPVDTGIQRIVRGLVDGIREQFASFVPAPFALAGATVRSGSYETHYHIGTLVADDYGLKEMERRQLALRNFEAQRKGQMP